MALRRAKKNDFGESNPPIHHANLTGYIHSGEIMKLMDNAGGVVAVRHAHSNVVTAKVEEISFLKRCE